MQTAGVGRLTALAAVMLSHFRATRIAVKKSRKRSSNALVVTLATAHRLIDLTALVPKLLCDDRLVVVFNYRPIVRAFLNGLVVFVAHRGCTQLCELAEVDRIIQNTLDIDVAPQVRGVMRIRFAKSLILIIGRRGDMLCIENIGYLFRIEALSPHLKDTADDSGSIRINDRSIKAVIALEIAVGTVGAFVFARLCIAFKHGTELL